MEFNFNNYGFIKINIIISFIVIVNGMLRIFLEKNFFFFA